VIEPVVSQFIVLFCLTYRAHGGGSFIRWRQGALEASQSIPAIDSCRASLLVKPINAAGPSNAYTLDHLIEHAWVGPCRQSNLHLADR
jgi:hypothetical protein